jgi:hypothetical protein
MRQSGHCKEQVPSSRDEILDLLAIKFNAINYTQARHDIMPFIKDPEEVKLWSPEFFINIAQASLTINQ